jgi:hypothetical protein
MSIYVSKSTPLFGSGMNEHVSLENEYQPDINTDLLQELKGYQTLSPKSYVRLKIEVIWNYESRPPFTKKF